MAVYLVACAISVLACIKLRILSKACKVRGIMLWIPIIPYLFVSIFRYGIGNDYFATYYQIYDRVASGQSIIDTNTEPGFYLVNWIVHTVFDSPFFVFAIMAIIFHVAIYRYIIDCSDNIPLSMALLLFTELYVYSLNNIRQLAAIAICYWGMRFLVQGGETEDSMLMRRMKYSASVLLGSLFHQSALLFLLVLFVPNKKTKEIVGVILALTAVLIAVFGNQVREMLMSLTYGTKFYTYFGSRYDRQIYLGIMVVWLSTALMLMLARKRELKNKECDYPLFNNIVYCAALASLVSGLIPNFERFSMMFLPAVLVAVPSIISTLGENQKRALVLVGLICAVYVLRFIWDMALNGHDGSGTLVYHSVFQSLFA